MSRLLTFVPGMSLLHCTVTDNLLFEVGVLSGVISKQLKVIRFHLTTLNV